MDDANVLQLIQKYFKKKHSFIILLKFEGPFLTIITLLGLC